MGYRVPFPPDTPIEVMLAEYHKRFKHAVIAFGSAWIIQMTLTILVYTGVIH